MQNGDQIEFTPLSLSRLQNVFLKNGIKTVKYFDVGKIWFSPQPNHIAR